MSMGPLALTGSDFILSFKVHTSHGTVHHQNNESYACYTSMWMVLITYNSFSLYNTCTEHHFLEIEINACGGLKGSARLQLTQFCSFESDFVTFRENFETSI